MKTGSSATPTFVLICGMGAMSFMWTPVIRELGLREHCTLPIELHGPGFDIIFPHRLPVPPEPGTARERALTPTVSIMAVHHQLRWVHRRLFMVAEKLTGGFA
jgi:hypothetical protein